MFWRMLPPWGILNISLLITSGRGRVFIAAWAFPRGEGLLLTCRAGFLITVASLVAEPGSRARGFNCGSQPPQHRFSGRGTRAELLLSTRDLPGSGVHERFQTVSRVGRQTLYHRATREVPPLGWD